MTYDYKCRECGHEFEVEKLMEEAANAETCPGCGGRGRRVYSALPFRFKGAGETCALDGGCAGRGRDGHGTG